MKPLPIEQLFNYAHATSGCFLVSPDKYAYQIVSSTQREKVFSLNHISYLSFVYNPNEKSFTYTFLRRPGITPQATTLLKLTKNSVEFRYSRAYAKTFSLNG